MSSGTQVEMEWAGTDAAAGGAGAPSATAPNSGSASSAYLTDEEILGMESASPGGGDGEEVRQKSDGIGRNGTEQGITTAANESAAAGDTKSKQAEAYSTRGMPSWMAAAAADPQHGGEAASLWREHQEFRAAFASPEEARAVKELLPGGVRDVLTLREATRSVDRIDAALFSGDARAQSEVVAELARANPAAFRSMFAEAARVLSGMGQSVSNYSVGSDGAAAGPTLQPNSGQALRKDGEGWGTRTSQNSVLPNESRNPSSIERDISAEALRDSSGKDSPRNDKAPGAAPSTPHFDPAAYAAFERATNDTVARDVRGSINDTLARVMPEGVADGAARRIGEDIFNEVHRALAADRTLSEQVAGVLRDRQFGGAEQERVAALLAGRAKQLVPSVARRVIGEWTSSVLNTARSKAARQTAAASRVDIAAPGGSLDSMPLRQMSAREVNYASMSDEEILGM